MPSVVSRSAYGHSIQAIGPDHFRLSWNWDRKYAGSRLRFPQTMTRDTDQAGAERFARKWDVRMPEQKAPLPATPGYGG